MYPSMDHCLTQTAPFSQTLQLGNEVVYYFGTGSSKFTGLRTKSTIMKRAELLSAKRSTSTPNSRTSLRDCGGFRSCTRSGLCRLAGRELSCRRRRGAREEPSSSAAAAAAGAAAGGKEAASGTGGLMAGGSCTKPLGGDAAAAGPGAGGWPLRCRKPPCSTASACSASAAPAAAAASASAQSSASPSSWSPSPVLAGGWVSSVSVVCGGSGDCGAGSGTSSLASSAVSSGSSSLFGRPPGWQTKERDSLANLRRMSLGQSRAPTAPSPGIGKWLRKASIIVLSPQAGCQSSGW
mmetsp:Transcript_62657/g.149467  ORF Transcript_62657/g.149467 Transcript_62657/m.149467 type:complete len:294 (+) Transcript_62657:58-939(+)